MNWQKLNINKFEGLNSDVTSSLTSNEVASARDILNFHQEKLGKLVTRQGYIFGLYTNLDWVGSRYNVERVQPKHLIVNQGILGIGEWAFSEKLDFIDTDKLHIWCIRGEDGKQAFLFSPVTGEFKNQLLMPDTSIPKLENFLKVTDDGFGGIYSNVCDMMEGMVLLAPSGGWIEDFVDMNQYRRVIIVSDLTNGDMIIRDKYDTANEQNCDDRVHELSLEPNCLRSFDVDTIHVGLDPHESVMSGMGLYGYELQKSYQVGTIGYNDNKISNPDWFDDNLGGKEKTFPGNDLCLQRIHENLANANDDKHDTLITIATAWGHVNSGAGDWYQSKVIVNDTHDYIFTNAEAPGTEYGDVLKPLYLKEQEYLDKEGKKQKDISANVYVWEDLELEYFPCSDSNEDTMLLTETDRHFNKLDSSSAKATKLKVKDKYGRDVSLGVWQERYVWEMKDGTHTVPSSSLVIPDQLYSAIADTDMKNDDNPQVYRRFQNYEGIKKLNTGYTEPTDVNFDLQVIKKDDNIYDSTINPYNTPHVQYVKIWSNNNFTLTGELFWKIKDKLYSGLQHKYGGKDLGLAYFQGNSPDINEIGNLGCLLTVNYGVGTLDTTGDYFYEGVMLFTQGSNELDVDGNFVNAPGLISDGKIHTFAKHLSIPIFQRLSDVRTFNSLFDEKGKLRLAYAELQGKTHPTFQLVFPGWVVNPVRYSSMRNYFLPSSNNDMILNIITEMNGDDYDQNNDPDIDLSVLRPSTLIRAMKGEYDSLLWTRSDVKSEAKSRLLLQGACGIEVIKNGDYVYGTNCFTTDDNYATFDFASLNDNFDYDDIRDISGATNPKQRLIKHIVTDRYQSIITYYDQDETTPLLDNISVTIYGQATRFIGLEQLTSWFPASLLFGSPRVELTIKEADIPIGAKKLLIYRTKSTHSNDYDPIKFGLVKEVDVPLSGNLVYFDEIKDANLDFTQTPEMWDGITEQIHSRINMPAYERVYKFNYWYLYQPRSPRGDVNGYGSNIYDWLGTQVAAIDPDKGFGDWDDDPMSPTYQTYLTPITYVSYKIVYEDIKGIISQSKSQNIDITEGNVVVFKYLPPPFNKAYKYLKIYRSDTKETGSVVFDEDDDTVTFNNTFANGDTVIFPDITTTTGITENTRYYLINVTTVDFQLSLTLGGSPINLIDDGTGKIEGYSNYKFIGDLNNQDDYSEGIFIDNNIDTTDAATIPCENPIKYESRSGGIWSEPYNPNWYKYENTMPFDDGGKDPYITGVDLMAGNLIIFKENYLARVAIQGQNPPISREDVISREVGCIAPETLIHVNNILYFLSNKGFMMFDNTLPRSVDAKFNEELQKAMRRAKDAVDGNDAPYLAFRNSACGFNMHYNELYLSIPQVQQTEIGELEFHNYLENDVNEMWKETILGNVYVLNLDKQYIVKYGYQQSIENPTYVAPEDLNEGEISQTEDLRIIETTNQLMRLYHTNSLGELRSADIYPACVGDLPITTSGEGGDVVTPTPTSIAFIYIETPYERVETFSDSTTGDITYRDTDDIFDAREVDVDLDIWVETNDFPIPFKVPIKVQYKSKFFTFEAETLTKRIRRVVTNLFSKGEIKLKGITVPMEYYSESIREQGISQTFTYPPSVDAWQPLLDSILTGTNTNVLSFVPDTSTDDWYGKPIEFSIEIEAELRTQINELVIFWRPIYTYLY